MELEDRTYVNIIHRSGPQTLPLFTTIKCSLPKIKKITTNKINIQQLPSHLQQQPTQTSVQKYYFLFPTLVSPQLVYNSTAKAEVFKICFCSYACRVDIHNYTDVRSILSSRMYTINRHNSETGANSSFTFSTPLDDMPLVRIPCRRKTAISTINIVFVDTRGVQIYSC